MMDLTVLLQEPVAIVIPEFLKYGVMGLIALLGLAWGWIERVERIKIQDEKNQLYEQRNTTQTQLDKILEELKDMNR